MLTQLPGRDHSTPRHGQQVTPIPSRTGRRHRALPLTDHPPNVQGPSNKAKQGQAIYQGYQLQPPDAHAIQPRAGRIEGSCHCRYIQGGFSTGGSKEDCQEGI